MGVLPVVVIKSKKLRESSNEIMYGNTWIPLGNKLISDKGGAEFGESLDLSGDGVYLAIGSSLSGDARGKVEVKKYTGRVWASSGNTIEGAFEGENFGNSVQLSQNGKILVASGTGSDYLTGDNKGHVRSYYLEESTQKWIQFGSDIEGLVPGDRFGISLSMSSAGDSFIVGADNFWENNQRNGYVKAYQFSIEDGDWKQKGSDIRGNDESRTGFASAMSGDGNTVCVGDIWWKDAAGVQRGRVRCFKWSKNSWVSEGSDIVCDVEKGRMGYSLSLSYDGNRVAVGNRGDNSNEGSVSVYQMNKKSWKLMGAKLVSSEAGDQGGFSVALNALGDVLAWTARGHDSDTSGDNVGIVRVARWTDNQWKALGEDLVGESAGDAFGESVALSDEGTIMAASSNLNDVEYTRVYTLL